MAKFTYAVLIRGRIEAPHEQAAQYFIRNAISMSANLINGFHDMRIDVQPESQIVVVPDSNGIDPRAEIKR